MKLVSLGLTKYYEQQEILGTMEQESILIVEDNDVLRGGLREMLEAEGYRVYCAGNGQEALKQMDTFLPELILSDINMPQMDGFAFFNAVRSREDWVTIPFIFLTARSDTQDVLAGKNLGVEDYLTKPISRDELVTTVRSRLGRFRSVQMAQIEQAYIASLTALANAIEARVPFSHGHIERVTALSLLVAKYLGWNKHRLDPLRYGAILHDIGKIHISEDILFKEEILSSGDWIEIRQHPINGARMVEDVPNLVDVAPLVHSHHERWDGKGYPDGLFGIEIPEGARIIAVIDAFDAMTTVRPYGKVHTYEEAYREILNLAGQNYDPAVVSAFQNAWEGGEIDPILNR